MMRRVTIAACIVMMRVSPAFADAIDGQWCLASSHFEINGPKIRTPGGNEITGNYDRHGFTYVVPPSEEGAGSAMWKSIIDEAQEIVWLVTVVGALSAAGVGVAVVLSAA